MNKVLVFTATYNEVDNIASLVEAIFAALPACDVLVVDDNSPDRTGELLEQIRAREPRLHVIHRPGKNGLGTAHKLAVKYALAEGYDALVTMDADFSHDPSYLPEMMRQLEQAEFVIGSRYVAGGSCEYPLSRVVLSRVANSLTRALLGIPRPRDDHLLPRLSPLAARAHEHRRHPVRRLLVLRRVDLPGQPPDPPRTGRRPARDGGVPHPFRRSPRRHHQDLQEGDLEGVLHAVPAGCPARGLLAARSRPKAPVPAPLPSEHLIPCNACGSTFQVEEYPASNTGHAVSTYSCTSTGHESHGRIVQCLSCGLVYTNPQLASPRRPLVLLAGRGQDLPREHRRAGRDVQVQPRRDRRAAPPGRPHAGGGVLLRDVPQDRARARVRRPGGRAVGLGLAPTRATRCRSPRSPGASRTSPPDTKPFDVVCSWDVLEHVADPMAQLKLVNGRLCARAESSPSPRSTTATGTRGSWASAGPG